MAASHAGHEGIVNCRFRCLGGWAISQGQGKFKDEAAVHKPSKRRKGLHDHGIQLSGFGDDKRVRRYGRSLSCAAPAGGERGDRPSVSLP